MAQSPSKPDYEIDPAQPGFTFRDTDKLIILLTDASGTLTKHTVLGDLSFIRKLLAPADIFKDVAPTSATAGQLNQRYYHLREVVAGAPTRADLHVFDGLAWTRQVTGFVLDAANAGPSPTIVLTANPTAVVFGNNVVLTAPPSGGAGPYSVQFYADAQPIGAAVTAAPWQLLDTPQATGPRVYAAVVTDSLNKQASSQRTVQVSAASNLLPEVSLEANPNVIALGASTTLVASASDPDGTIATLEIFTDATLNTRLAVFNNTTSGNFSWQPPTPGQKLPVARATDNQGGVKVSVAAQVTVNGPTTPLINFTAVGNKTVGDSAVTLSATSTNTVTPITFASSNGAAVTVTQNNGVYTASFPATGTATLTASQAAGNGYAAGTATQSVTVSAPVGPPTYNGVVSRTLPADSPGQSEGIVWGGDGPQRIEFNKILDTKGNIYQLQITDSSGGPMVYLTYPDEYVNTNYTFYRANGSYITVQFPSADTNLTL